MSRSVITRILAAGAVALILIFALLWVSAINRFDTLMAGLDQGFSIQGTYEPEHRSDGSPAYDNPTINGQVLSRATFELNDNSTTEGTWRFEVTGGGNSQESYAVTGRFERTADPNVYTLFDNEGDEVGMAHLAYEERGHKLGGAENNRSGTLYCCYQQQWFRLEKRGTVLIQQDFSAS